MTPASEAGGDRAAVVQAVLFDMDGVLVDSEPLWFRVERDVMLGLGGSWSSQDQAACVGGTLEHAADYMILRSGSRLSPLEVQHRIVDGMERMLRQHVPLRAGARELLEDVGRAGLPCALVTSTHRRVVDHALDVLGRSAFAATVAGDEVTRLKPHPEPYLTAAARLGADPASCIVLEDSPAGIAAGEAAGCTVVGVRSVVPLTATATRPVVSELSEISVAWLRRLPLRLAPAR